MRGSRALWPALIAGSALVVVVAWLADLDSPLRIPIVLWFLLVCPGMAWARLLPLPDPYSQLSVAVALSVALEALTAGAFLYAGAWSAEAILAVVVALSLAGAAVQLLRPPRPDLAAAEQP